MLASETLEDLIELRRELHRHPEPAWREFYTTARLVAELETVGVDELHVGPDAVAISARREAPDSPAEFDHWRQQALDADADEDVIAQLGDGATGLVAVIEQGDGPHVGLRVDIDGLFRTEASDPAHRPARDGFRSEQEGVMHACGHDAHATIGVGVIRAIKESEFNGTLTVCFQPAEEAVDGGRAMVAGGHLDDVSHLFALHLGLSHPTGEIVAGVDGFLACANMQARFTGESAHAGGHPEDGRNAIQAMATAIQNLYAIPRHGDGGTRINVGRVEGGSSGNIIAESADIVGEVRGDTVPLREYMREHAKRIIKHAGAMHNCEAELSFGAEAPSGASDPALAEIVSRVAAGVDGVNSILDRDALDGSEDATYLMQHVQDNGGLATYVIVGTDHPTGHHTSTFDIDEASIPIAIEVLAGAIQQVGMEN